MKKFTVLLMASLALCASARQLTPQEALDRLGDNLPAKAKASGTAPTLLIATANGTEGASYYVFSNDKATLFLSANDVAQPMLGYVERPMASLDSIAPAMKWWLGQYTRQIDFAAANESSAERHATLSMPAKAQALPAIEPLCKTNWDQGAPYNNLCPTYRSKRTYTGCVATAMAQAMKYFNYPSKGTGSNSYTWEIGAQTLSMDFSEVTLDWGNMLDTYKNAFAGTAAQRTAVATLMQACAYACSSNFGLDANGGTAAYSSDMAQALISNFSYDCGIQYLQRNHYTADEWQKIIYDNLANVGPVLYGGSGSAGGHQFICDGYSSNGYFHINWGWSGASDGYFLLSALDPTSLGAGGGAGGFNYMQDAVVGMRLPVEGSTPQAPFMALDGKLQGSAASNRVTLTAKSSSDFMGAFLNYSLTTGVFNIGALLVNTATPTDSTAIVAYSNQTIPTYNGITSYSVALPANLANGTYTLTPAYQIVGQPQWQPMAYPVESVKPYITFTVTNGVIEIESLTPGSGNGSLDDIAVVTDVTSVETGDGHEYQATAWNFETAFNSVTILPLLATVSGNTLYPVHEGKAVIVDVAAAPSATTHSNTPFTFSLNLPENFDTGTYYLAFADADVTTLLNYYDYYVTVTKGSGCNDITITPAANDNESFFDLRGRRYNSATNLAPGIYIRKTDNSTEKIVVH